MRTLALLLVTGSAVAQGIAGFTDLTFPNPTTQGTANIDATVWYPATAAGRNAPLRARPGGYPVLVFLHGLNVIGSGYAALGQRFAEHDYVVVLGNTARSSATTQIDDAIATFPALVNANGQTGHFLQGALDMTRAGIAGHSMGGSTTPAVLAANPGYRAGFCFSPGVTPGAAQVQVPMGVCHGTGDTLLDWQTFGLTCYQNLTAVQQLRFFYVMNQDCNHGNIAGYVQASQVDRDVFTSTCRVALGFFDCFLNGAVSGLENAIGNTARAEPRLHRLDLEVRQPQLWMTGSSAIGNTATFVVAAMPGFAGLFFAFADGNWPSPFGTVLIDQATLGIVGSGTAASSCLWQYSLAIPNSPGYVGMHLSLQGLGTDHQSALRVTGRWHLDVRP